MQITLYNRIPIRTSSPNIVGASGPEWMRSSFPARGHSRIRSARVAKVWSSTDAKRNGNRGSFERALDEIQKSTAIFFFFFFAIYPSSTRCFIN